MNERKSETPSLGLARDLMTSPAFTAPASATVREVARVMLAHGVSAVPILDDSGALVGMASDGDLLGRRSEDTLRHWWLAMLMEGDRPGQSIGAAGGRRALEVMNAPVISVAPDATAQEVAEVLQTHRIKRVPVVDQGKVIGVISRSDLLVLVERASIPHPAERSESGLIAFLELLIGGVSLRGVRKSGDLASTEDHREAPPPITISADAFRAEVQAHRSEETEL